MNDRIYKPFWPARFQILDGYALLWRRPTWRGPIGIAGRNEHTHCEMAGWWGRHLMTLGLREFQGGRAKTLWSQVERYPGLIDVHAVDAGEDARYEALEAMKGKCGHDYNYRGLLAAAGLHLPFVRWAVTPDTRDYERENERRPHPEFCSEAFASAYAQRAEVDLVHELADRITEPGDIARATRYLFTLTTG
jgi:hypothetical protein